MAEKEKRQGITAGPMERTSRTDVFSFLFIPKAALPHLGERGRANIQETLTASGGDVPLGPPGQPEEVAPCSVFLACEESSYMTGQVLHPNGGEVVNG
jgi:NAD(P)-dependent dehydrogenase (short-subunit alcohol dehydrogenase family)